MKELMEKASENDWSADKLEREMKSAGVTADEALEMNEMSLDDMASVAGGDFDAANCEHWNLKREKYFSIKKNDSPKNDWGYHVKHTAYKFTCWNCLERWISDNPNFKPPKGPNTDPSQQ